MKAYSNRPKNTALPVFPKWGQEDCVATRVRQHITEQIRRNGHAEVHLFDSDKPQTAKLNAMVNELVRDHENKGASVTIHYVDPKEWGFK